MENHILRLSSLEINYEVRNQVKRSSERSMKQVNNNNILLCCWRQNTKYVVLNYVFFKWIKRKSHEQWFNVVSTDADTQSLGRCKNETESEHLNHADQE